jgi:hypothetical protein
MDMPCVIQCHSVEDSISTISQSEQRQLPPQLLFAYVLYQRVVVREVRPSPARNKSFIEHALLECAFGETHRTWVRRLNGLCKKGKPAQTCNHREREILTFRRSLQTPTCAPPNATSQFLLLCIIRRKADPIVARLIPLVVRGELLILRPKIAALEISSYGRPPSTARSSLHSPPLPPSSFRARLVAAQPPYEARFFMEPPSGASEKLELRVLTLARASPGRRVRVVD